ncbi:hypothetical protein CKO25_00590 [Thiocapsa imhoffii]|uniref:DUF1631 domain-containing protein n=1 Tax=Thiocapsa imhoffii TaxID=382777 RepID=A0A9X1B7M7_9GAMM|nr:DUF1631 domain-containing protein [Thiocapsa imhoffii]MBK1643175.1 hypothetical protein [Thiocapsa imhoffii]
MPDQPTRSASDTAPEPPLTTTSLSRDEALSLVNSCRDRLALGLATAFAKHIDNANDDFLGMADRATSMEQQRLYFSAMEFLTQRAQDVLQHFRNAYTTAFDDRVKSLTGGTEPAKAMVMGEDDELRLVDTDDFERDLAIGKLSARAACNCSQQLTALDRRLAALLRVPRISQDDNPLYPRTLFGAMLQALSDMDADEQLALVLLNAFERQTSVELPAVYADLNRFLVQSGVLPTIPLAGPIIPPRSTLPTHGETSVGGLSGWVGFEPSEDPSLAEHEGRGLAQQQIQAKHGAVAERLAQPPGNEDVFGQLARAIQIASRGHPLQSSGANLANGAPDPPLAAPGDAVSAGVTGSDTPVLGLAQLIQALNGLQRGTSDLRRIPSLRSVRIDPRQGNVLQQIRATPMRTWSRPLDAMTIDIVAMLFDAIFNDPELSATVRAELAKLQIPVLKVALVDKTFFSDRKHPARRLLDVVASSGIGRNEKDEPHLVEKIHEVVDAVVDGFESNLNVFAVQTYQLEEFLREEEELARSKAVRVLDQLEQRDRQEIAATRVGEELTRRTSDTKLPVLVNEFLVRLWSRVLSDVFVRAGEAGEPWQEAVSAMDDLIWSVQPKETAEERSRLLSALPDLLKRLRRGLERVRLEDAWDPFFDRLIRLHMAALHKEVPPEPDTDESGLELFGTAMAPPDSDRIAGQEPGAAEAETDADAATTERYRSLARSLEVGDWVEFKSFRGTRKTLRLGWVSKYRGVYLFTNRQGENALTLATTSLATHLRNGTARVLSQEALTDRAVARLFDQVMPERITEPG